MTNYIFSEANVKYDNKLPLDDLLSLADSIWKDVKKDKNIIDTDEELEKKYYEIYNKHHDFGTSFPLILRWMVYMDKYSNKAFKKFLIKYGNSNISNKKEFIIVQAEYLVYLYEENRHYNKKNVNAYRDFIIKQLLDEEEEIKKIHEEFQAEVKKTDNNIRKQLYEELINKKLLKA